MALLEVSRISKSIQQQQILDKVDFSLEEGRQLSIAGVTGSGKSTLLKIIAGLIQPDSGAVYFNHEKVLGPDEKLVPGHGSIAYLSQHFELRNNYRVEEILEYANKLDIDEFEKIIDTCRIGHLLKRRTDQLSGGEKQRIATARLLIGEPELLILDEPYSNLDIIHRTIMKDMIRDISREHKITCILVSHDPADTLAWADRILILANGQIIQDNTPEFIYRHPINEYAAGLLGPYYSLDPQEAIACGLVSMDTPVHQNLIIRPEQFQYALESPGFPVIVRSVRFAGQHYEITASAGSQYYIFYSTGQLPAKGDVLFLRLIVRHPDHPAPIRPYHM